MAQRWRESRRTWNKRPDQAVVAVGTLAAAKTPVMANAVTALDKGKPRAEPLMVAIAAVAAGMFIGTWIIGPMISSGPISKEHDSPETPLSYEQMIARPDPFPYRTPTPVVEQQAQTNYAAAAK